MNIIINIGTLYDSLKSFQDMSQLSSRLCRNDWISVFHLIQYFLEKYLRCSLPVLSALRAFPKTPNSLQLSANITKSPFFIYFFLMLANTCEASAQFPMSRPCKSFPLTQSSQRGRCQKVCFIFFDSCVNIFARSCLRNVCEEMSKVKIFQALYSPTHTPLPPPPAHTLGTYLSQSIELSVCCLHQAETKRLAICLVALIMSNKNV